MKKLILLSFMSLTALASDPKPTKTGRGSDVGRNAGVGTVQELARYDKLPDLEKVSSDFAKEAGGTFIKGLAEIAAAPSTQAITDNVGKNVGSEAAKTLSGAVVTTGKLAAGVALTGIALHTADKVADRFFPLEQEQANRAEAETRVIDANIKTLASKATLEEIKDDQAFTHCLSLYPKQVRNTHGCPGNCMPIYRRLSLLGKQEAAAERLTRLKKLDEVSVPTISAEQAEMEVRQSFEENKQGPMRKMEAKKSSRIWSSTITLELPEKSMELLEKRSSLSPKRFSRVLAEALNVKYPNTQASEAAPVLDKDGYPSHVAIHLNIDGHKAQMVINPAVK